MLNFYKCCFVLLVLQITVNAAPNVSENPALPAETSRQTEEEQIINYNEAKLDDDPYGLRVDNDMLNTETNTNQRQKRMFYDYPQAPHINVNYPGFSRNPYEPFYNNYEDPYLQIYRKVKDIADAVRQPQPPPPPVFSQYPIFLPVIYIPQVGCGCNNQPNGPDPNVTIRFPEYDDKRQVWGVVVNTTFPEEVGDGTRPISLNPLNPIRPPVTPAPPENENDGSRPISFVPIPPNRPLSTPPPPVEHGSVQAGASQQTTTRPQASRPIAPSVCDSAMISCCHQAEITYNCFVQRGCPNPDVGSDNALCTNDIILEAIMKFSKYYGTRN